MKAIDLSRQNGFVVDGDILKLSGKVTMDTISSLFKKGELVVKASPIREIDCKYLEEADSSFFSLVLFLQKRNTDKLTLKNLPDDVLSLMALYDLEPVLLEPPVKTTNPNI